MTDSIRINFAIYFAKKNIIGGWTAMRPHCGTQDILATRTRLKRPEKVPKNKNKKVQKL